MMRAGTDRHIDDRQALGRRLRTARELRGMSQRDLAYDGCSPAYLSRIESGDRAPSLMVIMELAELLEVRSEWLGKGEGEMDLPTRDYAA